MPYAACKRGSKIYNHYDGLGIGTIAAVTLHLEGVNSAWHTGEVTSAGLVSSMFSGLMSVWTRLCLWITARYDAVRANKRKSSSVRASENED